MTIPHSSIVTSSPSPSPSPTSSSTTYTSNSLFSASAPSSTASNEKCSSNISDFASTIPPFTISPPNPHPTRLHGRAFYKSLGSPKYILAPMVEHSHLAWRILVSRHLPSPPHSAPPVPDSLLSNTSQPPPVLSYTPMLHSRLYHSTLSYSQQNFPAAQGTLDGHPSYDRPLIAQFCANDPAAFLASAKLIAPYVDAVDLNLGCPQGIARKGHYGSFLQNEWELIHNLISTLHNSTDLSIPVTAKIRIFDDKQRTLDYARMVLSAGASFLAVHGRTREQKGHNTGLADWETIRYLRTHLPPETVIFANGNVLWPGDADQCLTTTGADGVMSAEGCLHNPTGIFLSPQTHPPEALFPRVDKVAREYLDILHTLVLPYTDLALQGTKVGMKTPVVEPNLTNVKSHLFKLFHALLPRYPEVRRRLAVSRPIHPRNDQAIDPLRDFVEVVDAVEGIIEQHLQDNPEDQLNAPDTPPPTMTRCGDWLVPHGGWVGPKRKENDPHTWDVPWYRTQPYLRPLPEEAVRNGAMAASILQKGTAKAVVEGKGSEKGDSTPGDGGDVVEGQERNVKRIKLDGSVNWNEITNHLR